MGAGEGDRDRPRTAAQTPTRMPHTNAAEVRRRQTARRRGGKASRMYIDTCGHVTTLGGKDEERSGMAYVRRRRRYFTVLDRLCGSALLRLVRLKKGFVPRAWLAGCGEGGDASASAHQTVLVIGTSLFSREHFATSPVRPSVCLSDRATRALAVTWSWRRASSGGGISG